MSDENKKIKKEYQVLARRYRPTTFSDLIGQEVMVKILTNAFNAGRIAHSFMLSGVRGIGKTTTARIIAKGLNCIGPDGTGKVTITPCNCCQSCVSISEGRNVDVLEVDAASRTGVADIREITDSIYYRAASARFKVYIIDEIHMLSNSAFNALLKTLEEPPSHAKFIFATTEVHKVPATVLSRCQKFDLRRIEPNEMIKFLKSVSKMEKKKIDDDCLGQIAKVSEGSMRDALSILEKIFADTDGEITLKNIREVLGLSDRTRIFELFNSIIHGDISKTLKQFDDLYVDGADPETLIKDLAEITHWVTVLKVSPELADDLTVSPEERKIGLTFSQSLSLAALTKLWQLWLKIQDELKITHDTKMCVEMGLIRVVYASNLPTPDDLIKTISRLNLGESIPTNELQKEKKDQEQKSYRQDKNILLTRPSTDVFEGDFREDKKKEFSNSDFSEFENVVEAIRSSREIELLIEVEENLKLVNYRPGRIEFEPTENASNDLASRLNSFLNSFTGKRWLVSVSKGGGKDTISERDQKKRRKQEKKSMENPIVSKIFELFPGSQIVTSSDEHVLLDNHDEDNDNNFAENNLRLAAKE
ncbi:MAG: DNA polymerase III subunit gamma/tau [Pseudomonadota bacterium]|nr:DNA polymerase III subunit gamma/tau [Pseudomonadota bacterium]